MTQASENADPVQYNEDQMIPYEVWGKDHWSTLAYVEHVCVECGGFEVGADSRMRQNRHNFRVMAEQNPRPRRPGSLVRGIVMRPEYGSRLNNGTVVNNHDDWGCVQDFVPYGLFTIDPNAAIDTGDVLKLSDKGQNLAAELRRHKAAGGQFANFVPSPELMA